MWSGDRTLAATILLMMMTMMWSRLLSHMNRDAQKQLEHKLDQKNKAAMMKAKR
jgi:hypothetical protein